MKKKYSSIRRSKLLYVSILFTSILFFGGNAYTQIATYPLITGSGNPTAGTASAAPATNANITAGTLVSGSQMLVSSYNGSGYRVKTNSVSWPISNTNGFGFDIPLSPKTGYDFNLTGVTASINSQSYSTSSTNLYIEAYYQTDGSGVWRQVNGAAIVAVPSSPTGGININFGTINDAFYNGHTYIFRFYVYASSGSDKNDNFRIKTLVFNGNVTSPPAVAPIVTTGTPSSITKYSATVPGSYSFGTGFRVATQSGVVWNTATNPTVALPTKTNDGVAGTITGNIIGLAPGSTYYVKAYAVTQVDTVYGLEKQFTTLPATIPVLTTIAPNNILPYKASSGGTNIDSGGLAITQKGVCWSTSANPTTASSKTTDGSNSNNFSSVMRVLVPGTHYYARAYAVNSLGTGYGNQVEFDASPAAPALIASPLSLNFGSVPFNSSATVFSYTLTGYNLVAGGGTINIIPPTGYTVSISPSAGFANPLSVNYIGASLPTKTIYVKLSTASYGIFNGSISHNGGGVAATNADSVYVSGSIIPDPTVTTNSGTDFWTGFGYQERMDRVAGNSAEAKLSLYISAPAGSQPAIINVEMPGISGYANFQQNITVAPGTIKEITGFPTGDPGNELNPSGLADTRLYYTGLSKRGIHIFSTNGVPISVWMHSYANNNSGAGTMLFPTNTWNSSYTVQAYGGQLNSTPYIGGFTNNSNPNSFFFVVANENNTPIWFTPSQDVLDSSAATIFSEGHTATQVLYQKGTTYGPIILNKGQVFNAMGFIQGSGSSANGLDLSGSTVRTNCNKKIAVFAGNGRCLVNASGCNASSGSDHMIQQMFPKVAWGTKYITVPTKTMEYNLFRIYVDSVNTKVWVNDPGHTSPITGLINNLYYQVQGSSSFLIESDKPINVTQFIVAGGCANQNGAKGNGDPEMIILSPVQQAINKATVYSAGIKNPSATYNGHYINVVIRKGGIASFRLDNAAVADTGINQSTANATSCYNTGGSIPIENAFVKNFSDTNYYIAKFKVSPLTSHKIVSDSVFNAIAYGMGDGESYGYNAGTDIKDLTRPLFIDNPYLPNNTNNTTCKNNTLYLKAVLPYPPSKVDSIVWYMGAVPSASPQANATFYAPTADSSYVLDGVTYYVYKNPIPYTFTAVGSYHISGLIGGTFASQCGSTSPFDFNINVVDPGFSDFSIQYNPCVNDTVKLFDASSGNGFPITKWRWNFGDNTVDTVNQNPVKVYATHAVYNIKLRAINSIGCYADTTKVFDMLTGLIAKFGVRDTICANTQVVFTDSSTSTGVGNIIEWKWTFGDTPNTPVVSSTNASQNHTYANPGTYTATLTVKTTAGCTETYSKQIKVRGVPVASFNMPAGICLPSGITAFTNTSTISDTTVASLMYAWNFGDIASGPNNTSTVTNPIHTYSSTGPFNILLTVVTPYGCSDDSLRTLSNVYPQPTASITAPASACLKDTVQLIDASTAGTGNTVTEWAWTFGDGGTSAIQNPKHAYNVIGNQTITLTVKSDKGCVSNQASFTINIKPIPNVAFSAIPNICLNAAPITITQATETTGMMGAWMYSGSGVSGNTFNPSTAGVGSFPIIATYTANNGCKDADTANVTVMPLPTVAYTVDAKTCEKTNIAFTDNSTPNSSSIQSWNWNFSNAPTSNSQNAVHNFFTAGSYDVTLTVTNSNNCTASLTKPVAIHNRPYADFSNPASVCLPDGNALFTNLSTVADDANPSYLWNFGNPNDATGSTIKNPTHHYSSTGPFTVMLTVTSQYGCVKDTTHLLNTVHAEAVADFSALPFEVCFGDSIKFSGSSASNTASWSWTLDDGNVSSIKDPVHTYGNAGTFNVTYFYNDGFGCKSNTVTKPVTVHPFPVMDAGPAQYVLQGSSVEIKATASGTNLGFLWTPNTFLNFDTVLNPICTPTADQFYTLRVTDLGGCYKEDTVTVHLLKEPEIPNVFSPNGDGINDKWEIGQLGFYAGCTVEIFNRNGQKIFNSIGYSKPWDGTINSKPLPVGTYYYIINPKNNHKVISGSVTILR